MTRFRLSTMFLLLTLAAIWMAFISNTARRQCRAVAWLTAQGASVRMDWQFRRERGIDLFIGRANHTPPGPSWLRRQLGDDYFQTVIGVDGTFHDLQPLAAFPDLRWLNLRDSEVSNIKLLSQLKDLERLTLSNTNVTDLSPITEIPQLQTLHLAGSPVSEIAPLVSAIHLQELGLNGTEVIDLGPLGELPNLVILHLDRVQLTDLTPLRQIPSLKQIRIHDPWVSDSQLENIRTSLPHLMVSR